MAVGVHQTPRGWPGTPPGQRQWYTYFFAIRITHRVLCTPKSTGQHLCFGQALGIFVLSTAPGWCTSTTIHAVDIVLVFPKNFTSRYFVSDNVDLWILLTSLVITFEVLEISLRGYLGIPSNSTQWKFYNSRCKKLVALIRHLKQKKEN